MEEYQRRLSNLRQSPLDKERDELEKQCSKIQKGIDRLIDSYTEGYLSKAEFDPRIKTMKNRLNRIQEQRKAIIDHQALRKELRLIVTNLQSFAEQISSALDDIDWETKRSIIRTLVKRIEIDAKDVNVVFRVEPLPGPENGAKNSQIESLQHCCRGNQSITGKSLFALRI